jgi:adenine-specific DNA-methyltransferase
MSDLAGNRWARELGHIATPLFGYENPNAGLSHLAMLDGVRASFLFSDVDDDTSSAADWAWSSNVRHHVLLKQEQIVVTRTAGSSQVFQRRSVESKLDEFLRFLELDSDNQKVAGGVDHLIRLFGRHRATLRTRWKKNPPDLETFLYLLALTEEDDVLAAHRSGDVMKRYALSAFDPSGLTEDYIERFSEEIRLNSTLGRRLFTPMAVRHAGGALFQEAHAEILSEPVQMTLFGLAEAGRQRLNLDSLGVFYTPPGLARLLTEIAIEPHLSRDVIRIHDPACGSGIFLCEAIRVLQRRQYTGRVILTGHDVSAPALQMARFSIASALLDWKDHKVHWRVDHVDFFDALITNKRFDVVLMNPPFRSWESLTKSQKQFVRDILEDKYAGRPDLSMAFIQESLRHLAPGGTLATLVPRGALESQGGQRWRQGIMERNDVRLIGSFSDHGLFRHAMVSIGAMIFHRKRTDESVAMIWADERPNSAETALRELRRRITTKRLTDARSSRWAIYAMTPAQLASRKSWLPTPNALGSLLDVIKKSSRTQVSDLFTVRQGIKTGLREAFVVSDNELKALPENEQQYFRRIAGGNDIVGGRIFSHHYMFFAPKEFATKRELLATLPNFSERLLQYEGALKRRRSKPHPIRWWEAARPRADLAARTPRILTKMFGALDMAAVDARGEYLPMQAFAWMPTPSALNVDHGLQEAALWWYCRILNSAIFFLLRREFAAAITAGGQLDVSPKFVDDVPLPTPTRDDLMILASVKEPDGAASRENYEIVAASYGTKLDDWPVYEAH